MPKLSAEFITNKVSIHKSSLCAIVLTSFLLIYGSCNNSSFSFLSFLKFCLPFLFKEDPFLIFLFFTKFYTQCEA